MFASPPQFRPKHGTAERWDVCTCDECLAGKGVAVCSAPPPIRWFLNCGPGGLEPLNRNPGEFADCEDRCIFPRPRPRSITPGS